MDTEQRSWMTLAECAAEISVDVELVRQWCIRSEAGHADGLPSTHFGKDAAESTSRKNRRVHADDWRAFKDRRRRGEQSQERQVVRALEVVVPELPSRAERKAMARGLVKSS